MNGGHLANILAHGEDRLMAAAGEKVILSCGGCQYPVLAIASGATYEYLGDNGVVEQWVGMDFSITRRDWEKLGVGDPQSGYTIQRDSGATFTCMSPKGMLHFDRPAHGESIRLHTKETG